MCHPSFRRNESLESANGVGKAIAKTLKNSNLIKLGYKKSALVRIDYKNKVVKYTAYYADDSVSNPTIVKGLITKIVGIL